MFSTKSEKMKAEQVLPGSGRYGGKADQTVYTHMSKCKNDKIKNE
jgi:hypothetical protein